MTPLTRRPLPRLATIGLALLAGLLIGLGFAPMGIWPATIAGVGLFSWLMAGCSFWRGFGLGLIAGIGLNTLVIHWIGVLGVAVAIGLISLTSLWFGLFGGVIAILTRSKGWLWFIPAAWVGMEQLTSWFPFGGFPWTRLMYTAVDQPLSGWFPWLGATGVSFLVALSAQLLLILALEVKPGRTGSGMSLRGLRPVIAGLVAIFLIGALLPLVPIAEPEQQVTVGLVQGNNNRAEKGTRSYARTVTTNHLSETIFLVARNRATGEKPLDFVLWPENATDYDPIKDATTRSVVDTAAQIADVPILVGAVMDGPVPDSRQTTGLWWTPQDGPVDRYDKRNLVPFGEWIPFRDFLLPRFPVLRQIGKQSIPGTKPGVLNAPTSAFKHLRVGDIICFELAWDETVYDTVRAGADVLVSQSNTNTYGNTFEVPQQLVMNRVRAMELGREVLASTLNSTSALIDARGAVHQLTGEFTAANRTVTMPLRSNINLAVWLSPWLSYAISLVVLVALLGCLIRRRVGGKTHE